jgi:histidine triad (HIT) family protein
VYQHEGMDCIFCSIPEGTWPSWRVYEDEVALAFLDIDQATPGHTLVVPRRHTADIWSITEDEASAVMRSVHRVAAQLRDTLQPLGLNVVQSNGVAVGKRSSTTTFTSCPGTETKASPALAADEAVSGRVG